MLQAQLGVEFADISPFVDVSTTNISDESSLCEEIEGSETLSAGLPPEMSDTWAIELYQAASKLKGRQVSQLLAQLPSEQATLANHLNQFAQTYQFDKICDWLASFL